MLEAHNSLYLVGDCQNITLLVAFFGTACVFQNPGRVGQKKKRSNDVESGIESSNTTAVYCSHIRLHDTHTHTIVGDAV